MTRIPDWADGLLQRPERYLCIYGGRGGGKSTAVALCILLECATQPGFTVAVVREFQVTLSDGAIALLWRLAQELKLPAYKPPHSNTISFANNSRIIALGSERNKANLRGLESAHIAWLEEGDRLSADSFILLDPSLRRPGSKIIITFNPAHEDDYAYRRFVTDPPPNSWTHCVNYGDYPQFQTPELDQARAFTLAAEPHLYEHIWNGALIPAIGSIFDASRISTAADCPDEPSVRAYDLAATEGGGDYTAGILLRRRPDGQFIIADIVRGQWNPANVEQRILDAARADSHRTPIVIEQGPGEAGVGYARHHRNILAGYEVHARRATGSKAERARPLASAINSGLVSRVPYAAWWPALSSELAAFSDIPAIMRGRHDDQVDALALAYHHIATPAFIPTARTSGGRGLRR